jgi:uracil-DNA glycosylase
MKWDDLTYWQSGEWQVVQEKLDDLKAKNIETNPDREKLFAALDAIEFDNVRVAIIGQDPYPSKAHATGIAFSVPKSVKVLPPTLVNMLAEYSSDYHDPYPPTTGDLTKWIKQGVLLWNVYPSCETGKPGSHHWDEWTYLTKEIIQELDKKGNVVFVFLGAEARKFSKYVIESTSLETSHPSPLGAKRGFMGSRIFSSINAKLHENGEAIVNWKL